MDRPLQDVPHAQPAPVLQGQTLIGAPSVPQLPPQMFTTASQLLDLTDKKLVVVLRDGRKLIGALRSWDQFGNLLLDDTIERIFAQNLYADIQRGLYLIRGENVSILGEIDLDKDDYIPPPFQRAPYETVESMKKAEDSERKRINQIKQKKLAATGFEGDVGGEATI
ncbi:Sm-like ribonucleoprotein [Piedraia hortae CBS 480.64]|uniref:U6 snRNA-associated Sm-like protein LSm1 n=1 Tax=Piedraia hortae CBS 480.64 TaxID=1314780 RepID=A0A6A7BWE2_9PEZI|nr:Sm-like ribonucleoprotein [Piedraia hortae CBS 480.64]